MHTIDPDQLAAVTGGYSFGQTWNAGLGGVGKQYEAHPIASGWPVTGNILSTVGFCQGAWADLRAQLRSA